MKRIGILSTRINSVCRFAVLLKWLAFPISLMLLTSGVLCSSAKAQSKDRLNPTRLTSNEFSGEINSGAKDDNYHFTFVAGPGEVVVTLTVTAAAKDLMNMQQVAFDLFDNDANQLDSGSVMAGMGRTEQVVKRVTVSRRQSVLLRIRVNYSSGPGRYHFRLSGAVNVNEAKPTANGSDPISRMDAASKAPQPRRDTTDYLECLPKQGTLIIKMKDGSKKVIDLNEAETVTVVP